MAQIVIALSSCRRQLKKLSRMRLSRVDTWLEGAVQIAMLIAVIALITLMLV